MHQAIRQGGVALVTGAAVGIGHAITARLAKEGMDLVLVDRDSESLREATCRIRREYPQLQVRAVTGNVTSQAIQQDACKAAEELGDLSLVVNNAAILEGGGPWEKVERWRELMEINFWAILSLQQLVVPTLLNQGGSAAIVNVGSKEGITTPPGNAAYATSKAALRVLTEQLAHELRQSSANRVTAHLLIPGYTFTPMNFPGTAMTSAKPTAPWSADQVVDRMIDGLCMGEFYIFCEDNEVTREMDQRRMQWSADDLILGRPALSRWHPAWKDEFDRYMRPVNRRKE